MCDEYYDARMKAFWRALAEAEPDEELDVDDEKPLVSPIVLEPIEPLKSKPKGLVR